MNNTTSKNIILLLQQDSPCEFTDILLDAIKSETTVEQEVVKLKVTDSFRAIYKNRARTNLKKGEPIKGFDQLISGLEGLHNRVINVATFETERATFVIFIDENATYIIGSLLIPAMDEEVI